MHYYYIRIKYISNFSNLVTKKLLNGGWQMRKLITIAILGLFILGIFGCGNNTTGEVIKSQKEPIVFGGILALTGGGSEYGIPEQKGAMLAVEEINTAGGINGRPLKIIWEDGRCNAKDASTAAQKLINFDKVKIMWGGACSSEVLGAAPVAESNKVILMTSSGESSEISNAGDYIFRNIGPQSLQANRLAEFTIENNWKKIGTLSENSDYAIDLNKGFEKKIVELSGEIVSSQKYNPEAKDYRTELTKILEKNPDAVFINTQSAAKGALALKQLQELDFKGQVLGNTVMASDDVLTKYKEYTEELILFDAKYDEGESNAANFMEAFKEKYNVDTVPYPFFSAASYDAIHILAEAVEQVGYDADRVKQHLYRIKNRKGAANVLTFDENGDGTTNYVAKISKNGKLTEIKAQAPTGEPIIMGFLGPMTGDNAELGENEQHVVEIALEEINNAGGINGRLVKVIYEDSRCSAKDATNAAKKLTEMDKVEIILGGICSGETLAAAPIAEQNKVILFSAFSSNPDIKNAGDYVFRNSVVDDQGAVVLAKVVAKHHKKVALLTENTAYPVAMAREFKKEFAKLGGEVIIEEVHEITSKDYRAQLTKIKAKNPDAVIFNAQGGTSGGTGILQAHELQVPGEYIATYYASGNSFLTKVGDLAEGIKFIDSEPLDKNSAKTQNLMKKYLARAGHKPSNVFEAGARYDSVYILKEAIEAVGYDAEKIKDYLYNIEFKGTLGEYHFDSYGEPVGIDYVGFVIKNGEPALLEE